MELNGKDNRISENAQNSRGLEQIATSAHGTVDKVASGAHRALDRVADAAGNAAGTLSQKKDQVAVAGAQLLEDLRNYVQTNPLVSIGIAAAIGFAFSRIVAPRDE